MSLHTNGRVCAITERGDCLELMRGLPDKSIDLILCDLPYGTTQNSWDVVIPFDPLWSEYKRLIRKTGAIVLTASQPFTTTLIASNIRHFRYALVWEKSRPLGFYDANRKPLKQHEDIAVFSLAGYPDYYPQGLQDCHKRNARSTAGDSFGSAKSNDYIAEKTGYPRSVLKIPSESRTVHPTQKPVALMEYLIRTYTQPGALVLDNCMGSGTTGVAAINTGRNFIGYELNADYFAIADWRIFEACQAAQGVA